MYIMLELRSTPNICVCVCGFMCYSELLPIKCILVPGTYILNISDILKKWTLNLPKLYSYNLGWGSLRFIICKASLLQYCISEHFCLFIQYSWQVYMMLWIHQYSLNTIVRLFCFLRWSTIINIHWYAIYDNNLCWWD